MFLPGSFNPFLSRLCVLGIGLAIVLGSYRLSQIARNISVLFGFQTALITLHYFYLFHNNHHDLNWMLGAYVAVIPLGACYQSNRALVLYFIYASALAVGVSILNPNLLNSIFLPGWFTILSFGFYGMSMRLRLLVKSRDQTQNMRNLFDGVFEGIVVHDKGLIFENNVSFSKIFGYSPSETIGKNLSDFIGPDGQGIKKDGSSVPIEVCRKNHKIDGKNLQLVAIKDVSEKKKSEENRILFEAAQKALKIQEEFVSIASHELKTPLTTIKVVNELIARKIEEEKPGLENVAAFKKMNAQLARCTDRLIALVNEMLDFSKFSGGEIALSKERFDLRLLLAEVIEATKFNSTKGTYNLIKLSMDHPVIVYADRLRIHQAIENLILNAIKYGNNKPIDVSLVSLGHDVKTVVQDHGIGIAKEDQSRIFQKFERAISSRYISGLGLGLYIAKTIVDAHGGRIELESAINQGSSFSIVLPTIGEAGLS